MANEITRLLPFRQYDENDVINFYSLDTETGEAGSVVKVDAANLTEEPVKYVQRGDSDSFQTTLGKGLSMYPEVPYKVTKCSVTGAGVKPLGILLRDVRNKDENGENLLYYPEKKEELQCVVSGEAVPVATRGLFTINTRGLTDGVVPAINSFALPSKNGTITGIASTAANHHAHHAHSIGQFIATGNRESQGSTTDVFAGAYAILKLRC
jgi:hypothetical protein|tara:strand:+ start:528 stop:1157 length:630 start_codon:yes stop_codon:yes gene_type:complete